MGNLLTSSIGKKLIMSLSGFFLMIFLIVHLTVNATSLIGPEAFKAACEFMALPIVKILVPVLAAGFIIHIAYATMLTISNLRARGNQRYEVSQKGEADSWAARNMFVLGIIILGFLAFHLSHFWAEMQLKNFMGQEETDPNFLMSQTFGNIWILIAYIIWFAALWFHLTHGFWSAFQSVGLNNGKWLSRLKVVAYIFSTIIAAGFIVVAIAAHFNAVV
jgi:succinate dehydrogenase / fumarate reductase cytochrome b subunit